MSYQSIHPDDGKTIKKFDDNCEMVYGDAQAVLVKMIEAVRGPRTSKAAA